jgi:chemotaxis methyl-accepting protein methylase
MPADRSDDPPDEFIAWVLARAGLDATAYRTPPLVRRLPACLRALKASTPDAARSMLERTPDLLAPALNALLIGVTTMFREPEVYQFLRAEILPAWSVRSDALRIWSAACSSGDELCSMAMILADAGLLERSYLLGTDCRGDAVAQARAGLYEAAALGPMGKEFRDRYLERAGRGWRPVEALRRQLHWKVADVLSGVEAGPWDMILWRNAAMYLNANNAETVWRQLASVLRDGGVLVVGKAERPPLELGLKHVGRCVYRSIADDRRLPCSAAASGGEPYFRSLA